MDDFEKIISGITDEAERESLSANKGLSRLLLDLWSSRMNSIKKHYILTIVAVVVAVSSIVYSVYLGNIVHAQQAQIQELKDILDNGVVIEESTTTETTTTTQTVDGETATINNNNGQWEQYNAPVTKNEGGN